MLQHLMDSTPRGIYWAYLCARARALNLPRQTPETWRTWPGRIEKKQPKNVEQKNVNDNDIIMIMI